MADRAARGLEELIAFEFELGDGVLVALEPLVEAVVRRHERPFEFGDGVRDALDVDLVVAEGGLEVLAVAWDRGDHFDGELMGRSHFQGIRDGARSLFGKGLGAAVPELGDLTVGIENRRRIDRPLRPAVADRSLQVVDAARGEIVAGVAGDEARAGKTRFEVEHLAQLHQSGIFNLDGFNGVDGFGGKRRGGGAEKRGQRKRGKGLFHGFLS